MYTAAHKRFRGSNEKIYISPPCFLHYNFLRYWMLWDCTPHPRPFTFSASYIPLLFVVLQFFHSVFLFLIPPPLPTWAFLFAILFLVFCPMNKIQAPCRSRASWSSVSTGQANKSFLWFLPPARLDLLHLNARADIVVPCHCTLWVAVLARGGSCTHAALRSVST